ncbi:Quinic acid utilization activator [Fulvia fulva]|uniref:Quinic acid utilization activator n=1 Tax=Passalora fulva TaxID=5499 RepID=A0A9Q8PCQ6_PASFU|nr:Quinic acid utilization activator [Fulvia fulva]KAK4619873.1 Quinic acid utilization activator [Fulvia fulva]KAK4620505.1 Quinic acid utilization activator [Fulvia fulva]UJO20053.1 Quinic acid utilization activator [Fulvia fulva]WPV17656.1 Quinic acid utilization activator [Fulvia fulva]WPV32028.1 Quinic acid utilization activator [Fulvia fulva]
MTEDGNETPAERTQGLNANGKRPLEATSSSRKADKAKRVRVSRACDQCRAGREKCDGAQPTCHTCETQSRTCTYHEQPRKRGIQPNYIRTLELTLAWILQRFPDSENQLSQRLPRTHEPAHRVISFKDAVAAEVLHATWRSGIISRQIEQLLSGSDIDIPQASSSRDLTTASYQSPPLSVPSDNAAFQSEHQEITTTSDANVLPSQHLHARDLPPARSLVLPQDSWALLEHYFTFTQTWLPITEKHDIMRLMYSFPAEGLPMAEARAAEYAELWSIMAWSAFGIGPQSGTSFEQCHSIAKALIPTNDGLQLGHVKALLILGVIELARSSYLAAWLTIGSAVRVLTHYQSGQGLGFALGGTRVKHTVLAAFLLEQVVASHTGAVGHLKHDNVRALGLLVEDGLEEWEPWNDPAASSSSTPAKSPARSISTFNALVRLALSATARDAGAGQIPPAPSGLGVVSILLRNATAANSRLHPMRVLAAKGMDHTPSFQDSPTESMHQAGSLSVQHHGRTTPSPAAGWGPRPAIVGDASSEQHYPFMSIPNEAAEPFAANGPAQTATSAGISDPWTSNTGSQAGDPYSFQAGSIDHAATGGGDIFEELAMLERTDSTHNPNFMQNLGFGPDLDLAEFFGADVYQPSDPLLGYMQPESLGDMPQDFGGTTEGAG